MFCIMEAALRQRKERMETEMSKNVGVGSDTDPHILIPFYTNWRLIRTQYGEYLLWIYVTSHFYQSKCVLKSWRVLCLHCDKKMGMLEWFEKPHLSDSPPQAAMPPPLLTCHTSTYLWHSPCLISFWGNRLLPIWKLKTTEVMKMVKVHKGRMLTSPHHTYDTLVAGSTKTGCRKGGACLLALMSGLETCSFVW